MRDVRKVDNLIYRDPFEALIFEHCGTSVTMIEKHYGRYNQIQMCWLGNRLMEFSKAKCEIWIELLIAEFLRCGNDGNVGVPDGI